MEKSAALLDQPEYVHVIINHLPLTGVLVAMIALAIAIGTRNRTAMLIGLILIGLVSLSAWPVYYYGEAGYDRVLSLADRDGQAFLEHHKELAERWIFAWFVTAGAAVLGLVLAWKWPNTLVFSSLICLVLGVASLVAGFSIGEAGGSVRHREFRFSPPPEHHQH